MGQIRWAYSHHNHIRISLCNDNNGSMSSVATHLKSRWSSWHFRVFRVTGARGRFVITESPLAVIRDPLSAVIGRGVGRPPQGCSEQGDRLSWRVVVPF